MEKETNPFWIQNTRFGLLIGATFIITSGLFYATQGTMTDPRTNNVIMLLTIAGMYLGAQKYRNDSLEGIITYWQAIGACTWQVAVASFIYGAYTCFIYTIRPAALEAYLDMTESILREVYAGSPVLENMIPLIKNYTTPFTMGFAELFYKTLIGFIFSLFIAFIVKRDRPLSQN